MNTVLGCVIGVIGFVGIVWPNVPLWANGIGYLVMLLGMVIAAYGDKGEH